MKMSQRAKIVSVVAIAAILCTTVAYAYLVNVGVVNLNFTSKHTAYIVGSPIDINLGSLAIGQPNTVTTNTLITMATDITGTWAVTMTVGGNLSMFSALTVTVPWGMSGVVINTYTLTLAAPSQTMTFAFITASTTYTTGVGTSAIIVTATPKALGSGVLTLNSTITG